MIPVYREVFAVRACHPQESYPQTRRISGWLRNPGEKDKGQVEEAPLDASFHQVGWCLPFCPNPHSTRYSSSVIPGQVARSSNLRDRWRYSARQTLL